MSPQVRQRSRPTTLTRADPRPRRHPPTIQKRGSLRSYVERGFRLVGRCLTDAMEAALLVAGAGFEHDYSLHIDYRSCKMVM
ncbi:hypothetical protein CcI49_03100 [Frankia sp. CcI49]|nr:hypothetical protein CcI49_03100 [Frankia sp. CcI49]